MTAGQPTYTVDEFERESRYIDRLIGEAMSLASGEKVLFCGYGPDGEQVRRAVDNGVLATVIEHRDSAIRRFANIGARLLRGSTSVIPARDNSFDAAVSFHYLHEIDPFFHAQVMSELARVARRVVVVEPAPPADPLGKRIALLYSQAKRELGQFEYYQPMEYWKKLLQAVKADVAQHVFAFAKVPPAEYLKDTVALLLRTIEVEAAPKEYIDELRQIAARTTSQLLPPPRFVLAGAALGALPKTHFTPREEAPPPPLRVVPAPAAAPAPVAPAVATPRPAAPTERAVSADTGYEFPPLDVPGAPAPFAPAAPAMPQPAPAAAQQPPAPPVVQAPAPPAVAPPTPAPPAVNPLPNPFRKRQPRQKVGWDAPVEAPPQLEEQPFGAPFAMPPETEPFGAPPAGIPPSTTWQWEPPEGQDPDPEETPFGPK